MEKSEYRSAREKLEQLKAEFQVEVLAEWGDEKPDGGGEWKIGSWSFPELERLHKALTLVAGAMGGNGNWDFQGLQAFTPEVVSCQSVATRRRVGARG